MKYTKARLLAENPCADGLLFAKLCEFDFHKIYNTCERGDWLMWLLRKSGNLDKPKAVELAIACAQHVLPILEKKYPAEKLPRTAIEAAIQWLKNPNEDNRKAAAAAADATYAAAVTYATYAAAAAAAAATDATYAAAAAAAAATYAAYATDATYDAAAIRATERKWQADKIREIVPNPFEI